MVEIEILSAANALQLVAEFAAELSTRRRSTSCSSAPLGLAVDIVPGCEEAGISLLQNRMIETPASFGSSPPRCDKLQEQLGDGPCITALLEADIIRIDDVTHRHAVARRSRGAAAEPVCAACWPAGSPTQRDKLGALNMYSTTPERVRAPSPRRWLPATRRT